MSNTLNLNVTDIRQRLHLLIARDRGVLASYATAVAVRGAGALTNLLAMPIALHILGAARFGTFLVLFGLINWVALGTFGVQSALGKSIASGETKPSDLPELLGAALLYALVGATLFAVAIAAGVGAWMGLKHVSLANSAEAIQAGALMMILIIIQVVLQVFEGVQLGSLTSYITNLTKLAGSAFTFVVLFTAPHFWKSMGVFVIAISGGLVLGGALNAALVARRSPPRFDHLRGSLDRLRSLTRSGAAFVLISLTSLAESQGLVLLLAATRGANAVVEFGLYIRLLLIYFSVVAIITGPLWPALISARAAGDRSWSMRTIRRTAALLTLGGVSTSAAIGLFGEQIISFWTHTTFHGNHSLQISMGFLFMQMTWSHFWAVMLLGKRDEHFVSYIYMAEVMLIIFINLLLANNGSFISISANIAILLFTNWILPIRYIYLENYNI